MKLTELFAVLLLGSFTLSLILNYFLNLYNKNYYSVNKEILIENCEITKISESRKSRGYYFRFKGSNHFVSGWSDDLKKIETNPEEFIVKLQYRESFFNSYVIVDKKIISR